MHKNTKIVATIGPASADYKTILKMVNAGMNVARLNFSHGTYKNHEQLINAIRQAEKSSGRPIGIMQDIQGPKIRLGILPKDGVYIKASSEVVINTGLSEFNGQDIPFVNRGLEKFIKQGDRILVDDGHLELIVRSIAGTRIFCKSKESWTLTSNKGINLPDSDLDIPILSEKDKKDIQFGLKMGVDMMALSFIHNADDIKRIRAVIKRYETRLKRPNSLPVFLISKIERNAAVQNIDEILKETDGVMVARGDLAMETDMAELPIIQKKIIDKALNLTKPVIVATQMLDSMQVNRRPTRAEITDVANAVIDHADALMLSNETATGKFPVESVQTMSEIIMATEESKFDDLAPLHEIDPEKSISRAVAGLAGELAVRVGAKAILVASATGKTGRLAARIRSQLPVFVGVESIMAQHQLCLSWGIKSFLLPHKRTVEDLISEFLKFVKKSRLVKKGDRIVMITGEPVGKPGSTNLLEVKAIK